MTTQQEQKFVTKYIFLSNMKAFLLPFLIISQALCNSIYDLKATDIHGLEVNFNSFRGKVLLIVNVASECGFTDSHYRLSFKFSEM